jgi:hypothetical protein
MFFIFEDLIGCIFQGVMCFGRYSQYRAVHSTFNRSTNTMDKGFKEFLLEDAKKWNPETRLGIAKMLKTDAAQLKNNILDNLMDWATVYCVQKGVAVISERSSLDTDELMEAWREILKKELATVE